MPLLRRFFSRPGLANARAPRARLPRSRQVFVGGDSGEATIGSRPNSSVFRGVAEHASFRSYAADAVSSEHSHRLFFRSIDSWLRGVCVSHCKECSWGEHRSGGANVSSLFRPEE
eukprot:4654889-Prymnesium_polylepis.1